MRKVVWEKLPLNPLTLKTLGQMDDFPRLRLVLPPGYFLLVKCKGMLLTSSYFKTTNCTADVRCSRDSEFIKEQIRLRFMKIISYGHFLVLSIALKILVCLNVKKLGWKISFWQ